MIIYKEFDISEMADVVPIYENIGWTMYLRDKDKLFSGKLPKDEFDRNGYITFWKEWHRRRTE